MFDLMPDAFTRLQEKVSRRALRPSWAHCSLRRTSVSKLQGALAGLSSHLFEQLGPRLDGG